MASVPSVAMPAGAWRADLYGITKADISHVVDSFHIIPEEAIRNHGEYMLQYERLAAHTEIVDDGSRGLARLIK